jgi:hypothetical protein
MEFFFHLMCCLVLFFQISYLFMVMFSIKNIIVGQSNEHSPLIIDLQKEHCAIHLDNWKTILLFNISTMKKKY